MNNNKTQNNDEPIYFSYSAALRIFGNIPDLGVITNTLGCEPTHYHTKGEPKRMSKSVVWEHDMWSYTAPVSPDRPLDTHIKTLWDKVRPHKEFLMRLKEDVTVDVFCGYKSNAGTAGFEVNSKSLEMFVELDIPFGLSIIVV